MGYVKPHEVVSEQILLQPKRYEGYHSDLAEILRSALSAARALDETPAARRTRLAENIRAKATQA